MTKVPHEAYLAAMSSLTRVGPGTLRRLLALGPPARVWDDLRSGRVPREALAGLPGPSLRAAESWPDEAAALDPAEIWRRCERLGAGAVSLGSPGYPVALVEDPEPPVVLFHLGDPDVLAARRVAVVGTRRATGYGVRVAAELGYRLAAAGVCVVSGLALGIDAAAHRGAVRALQDGPARPPAAVVGGGLDAPGPVRNAPLARTIAERGVILSEVPPGVTAEPWRFPVRNRILAGLAELVVVVESAPSGGSLLTVAQAQLRDRPVLAVPGPVDSHVSSGTNQLLEEGAGVCTGPGDVLSALGVVPLGAPSSVVPDADRDDRPPARGAAGRVLEELGWRPCTLEQLAGRTGLDVPSLARAVGALERDGWALRRGGFVERVARGAVRDSDVPGPYGPPR